LPTLWPGPNIGGPDEASFLVYARPNGLVNQVFYWIVVRVLDCAALHFFGASFGFEFFVSRTIGDIPPYFTPTAPTVTFTPAFNSSCILFSITPQKD